eukprot:2563447-Rhodomonas_salina.2
MPVLDSASLGGYTMFFFCGMLPPRMLIPREQYLTIQYRGMPDLGHVTGTCARGRDSQREHRVRARGPAHVIHGHVTHAPGPRHVCR